MRGDVRGSTGGVVARGGAWHATARGEAGPMIRMGDLCSHPRVGHDKGVQWLDVSSKGGEGMGRGGFDLGGRRECSRGSLKVRLPCSLQPRRSRATPVSRIMRPSVLPTADIFDFQGGGSCDRISTLFIRQIQLRNS